jgi:co-chaperonin GroES (HSP10)|tara:strand:- start:9741 stop:10181 length:441 start_codon:yes stop_codon:yes gene_type:complete
MTGTRSLKIVQNMTKEALKTISEPESIEEPIVSEKIKSQLPEPKGWKILVAMPLADEKTKGGILKAASTVKDEELSNICGYILQLGKECYQDSKRFPSGPWCKKGDWVIFRAYSGTRIKMYGQEFRLINDDTVEAVVDDPTGVVRA